LSKYSPGRGNNYLVTDDEARLRSIIGECAWLMRVLATVRDSGLPDAWAGAGTVRDLVWGQLFGPGFAPADVRLRQSPCGWGELASWRYARRSAWPICWPVSGAAMTGRSACRSRWPGSAVTGRLTGGRELRSSRLSAACGPRPGAAAG
jgi:hypothetical protein